jgi:protein tyrosine phosphatase (PTP) superfamily phosphohydrolase (DUF442 family)
VDQFFVQWAEPNSLDQLDYPAMTHCKSGADRAGMMIKAQWWGTMLSDKLQWWE